jgi:predicted RNase H-like HicB family nuclease
MKPEKTGKLKLQQEASECVDSASDTNVELSRRNLPRGKPLMQVLVQAQFQLFGVLKKEDGWHVAYCPPLDITTQGRTEEEAKKNLVEASELFVVSCFERGTFEQALRELGWHVVAGRAVPHADEPVRQPVPGEFSFPVPVPFGFEKAAPGCHV